MQTFLPHRDFKKSAQALDSRRLNKQLLEGRQIYSILVLHKREGGWRHHPAVLMWKGHEEALYEYLEALRDECEIRGIRWQKNWEEISKLRKIYGNHEQENILGKTKYPEWLGKRKVHESHKFNLFRKDPEYYSEYRKASQVSCCEKCNYFWPTHIQRTKP